MLNCDSCGKIDYVLVDGYSFGDRLLEGVKFIVKDENDKPKVVGVVSDAEDYFNDLNKEKWLKICAEYCKGLDVATCPKCGEDVGVWGAGKSEGVWVPMRVPMTRIEDIRNGREKL